MTLGKTRTGADIHSPFCQANAFTTNHPVSPSKSGFADDVGLPTDSVDPISRVVDDRDGRNAKG